MSTRIALFRGAQVAIDLSVLMLAFSLGFLVRFDWQVPPPMLYRLLVLWPYIVGFEYLMLVAFGVPRYVWRYVGLREASRILGATAVFTGALILVRAVSGQINGVWAQHAIVPYGVIAINFTLAFLGIVGVRALRRLVAERWGSGTRRRQSQNSRQVRTLLIGAGQSGLLVAKEIQSSPELGIVPVAFLDDDLMKKGTIVHGIPVLGAIASVRDVARTLAAKQALITVSHAHGETVRRIAELCRQGGLEVKIIPGVSELVEGKINLSRIRDVAIEDLLRREPVELDSDAIALAIKGQVVMVTGAGGSIGSELCRQICRFEPQRLLLLERAENALFEIHRELAQYFPEQATEPCLADLCDRSRVDQLLAAHRPQVVFHAAAHKHVPMMEQNPCEAVKNNVQGTRLLAELADLHQVSSFVMISTDKAVHPTSVMGASKRAAEIYVQSLSRHSDTRFVIVRFGNVLGSAGSVVPIFKRQIAQGGPITITHPDMQRYFMTIPEAAQLVLQAGTMGQGGEIFILDMGEPVKVVELARDLVRLSGFRQDEIRVEFTGIRPGEKLSEELSTADEQADKTRHPKILVGRTPAQSLESVRLLLDRLVDVAQRGDGAALKAELGRVVVDYRADGTPEPKRALPEASGQAAGVGPASAPTASEPYDPLPASVVLAAGSAAVRPAAAERLRRSSVPPAQQRRIPG